MPVFLGVSVKDQIAEKNRVQNPNFLRAGAMADTFTSIRRPCFYCALIHGVLFTQNAHLYCILTLPNTYVHH